MCGRVCSPSRVKGGRERCGVCHAFPVVWGAAGVSVVDSALVIVACSCWWGWRVGRWRGVCLCLAGRACGCPARACAAYVFGVAPPVRGYWVVVGEGLFLPPFFFVAAWCSLELLGEAWRLGF